MGRSRRTSPSINDLRKEQWSAVFAGREKTVTPGRLDTEARYIYTYGQCAYLALAIYERTSSGIWAIVGPDYDDEDGSEIPPEKIFDSSRGEFLEGLVPDHFGVLHNDQMLDINGLQDFEEWEDRHGGYAVPVTERMVLSWQKYHERLNQWQEDSPSFNDQLDLARSFVKPLLTES